MRWASPPVYSFAPSPAAPRASRTVARAWEIERRGRVEAAVSHAAESSTVGSSTCIADATSIIHWDALRAAATMATAAVGAWACCRRLWVVWCVVLAAAVSVDAALTQGFYSTSCPNVESIVSSTLRGIFARDVTARAAMIRLIFHDCQVFGCDASILLDSGPDGTAELESPSNLGIRRLDIIDTLKKRVEAACPQTVSCADLIAMAARDAVSSSGGPQIAIPFGRFDGFRASEAAATADLPPATISVSNMINLFGGMGMSTPESVAILGAHTVGVAHCSNFVNRLYPVRDPNMGLLYANTLKARCPRIFSSNAFAALDTTDFRFDNVFFRNVLNGRGLLTIDSEMGLSPTTEAIVQNFADNQEAFFNFFSSAFVKLSSNNVLSAGQGEIRRNCHVVN